MNSTLRRINRLYRVIDNSLFMVTGNLDYSRITDATERLAHAIAEYDGDNDDWLYIGECRACALADYIVGAYWHFSEWHGGQWTDSYRALCALGRIFDPGMTYPEIDNEAYQALNALAIGDKIASQVI